MRSIAQEVYVFFSCVFSGLFIGVLYDLLRTIRSGSNSSSVITAMQDAVFWGLATAFLFFTVFHTNNGAVRWYELFGTFLGGLLYFFALSKFVFSLLKKASEIFLKIFSFFCKILLTPLGFAYNILYRGILFIFVPIFNFFKRLIRRLQCFFRAETKRTKHALLKK